MKGLFQIFYTHKRAEIILADKGIKAKVMKINITRPSGRFFNCVQVIYRTVHGVCSLFVSCKEFLIRAVNKRKEAASEYTVTQRSNTQHWDVVNNADITSSGYLVITAKDLVTCSCRDFEEMGGYLPQHPYLWKLIKARRACKHIYAVFNELNCTSLINYFNKVKAKQLPQIQHQNQYSISEEAIRKKIARL